MNKMRSLLVAAALMLSFAIAAPIVSAHEGHNHPKKTKKKSAKSSKKRAKKRTVAVRAADGHNHKH